MSIEISTDAYDEQRSKVARAAAEWARSYIALQRMAHDLKHQYWRAVQAIAPRVALEPDTRRIDAQLAVAGRLLQCAMGLHSMSDLPSSDDLAVGRCPTRHIGDLEETADPLRREHFCHEPWGNTDELDAAMAHLRATEPTAAMAIELLQRLSASETRKAREWEQQGRADMREICAGRASVLNRALHELGVL